jgi:hypothetical protein
MTRVEQMKTDFYSASQNKSVEICSSMFFMFNNDDFLPYGAKKSVKIRFICVIRVLSHSGFNVSALIPLKSFHPCWFLSYTCSRRNRVIEKTFSYITGSNC